MLRDPKGRSRLMYFNRIELLGLQFSDERVLQHLSADRKRYAQWVDMQQLPDDPHPLFVLVSDWNGELSSARRGFWEA